MTHGVSGPRPVTHAMPGAALDAPELLTSM
jgi:hypothetical protein